MTKTTDPEFLKEAKASLEAHQEQMHRARHGGRDRTEELAAIATTIGKCHRAKSKRPTIAAELEKIIQKLSALKQS